MAKKTKTKKKINKLTKFYGDGKGSGKKAGQMLTTIY
jgi:hypothetical protein